ncbi:lipopolysaccharide biosynthesis protein [Oceanobacillus alkalisoli]|uniref:lipopolysaccharide biosynthesis protein n=1 Tax=Oceanobacillus alkalisoli TaxID=2925113 RepID=UPI001F11B884|nr:lipopolysaccharide biosynthesis protein [Oceanobacillus alkalisoli]MCF3942619.1 lipopolysaccharide biosynthesis protein [Oceanobacillus alkalisoli]
MKNKITKLIKSSFVRNVLIMLTGTAGAQVVAMALSPIITRLYGPEAFGVMGTFNSMISILIPIVALTYPIAIVLPKSAQDAKGLVRLSLIITVFFSFLSLLVLFFFQNQIVNIFNLDEIAPYLYLIPLVVIFSGLLQVSEQWLIRVKQFSISARVTFFQSIILNGSKVGIGLIYPVAAVLVVITAIGNGLKAMMLITLSKKNNQDTNKSINEKKKTLKELATEYYDFPLYRAPESFLSAITQGLPVLMLTAFFGPASAGFYSIGRTVLSIPVRFIGKSVGDVFYPRIAEAANNKENVTELIKKATLALSGVGIIPFGVVMLFGPFIFSLIFGSEWEIAGEYARWIALWSFTNFINRPSVRSLAVLNSQRFHLVYTVVMFIIRTVMLAIGFYLFSSDLVAVALFSISGAILNAVLILATLSISKKKFKLND